MKIEIALNNKIACSIEFDLQYLAEVQECEGKKRLRQLYADIATLDCIEELSLVSVKEEQKETKETLNSLRAEAIKTWLTFYKAYNLGSYEVSAKDRQITAKQCRLILDETLLRKYFECSEWFAANKLLYKYCSADIQNMMQQKKVEAPFPKSYDLAYYNKLGQDKRNEYIRYLLSIGFVKKRSESGLTYVKQSEA